MYLFFFFNDTATTEIYTLSLHDALPISAHRARSSLRHRSLQNGRQRSSTGRTQHSTHSWASPIRTIITLNARNPATGRSEEHTSELQSRQYLVCRLLLEKKKQQQSESAT